MSFPNFVKKYDIGAIGLDAPYTHFIYELPLLSFSDVLHTVGLSLVYQSKLADNPFYIANGYKLSLQKRLIMSGGVPQSYEDGNGTLITLNRFDDKYTFNDDSQRILRKIGGTFVLENADYSKELFDSQGKIMSIEDKYGTALLEYEYENGKVGYIKYRGSKTIAIGYTNNRLSYVQYPSNDPTFRIYFHISGNNVLVNHYSGVDYHIEVSGSSFTAYSADRNASYSNDYSHKVTSTKATDTLTFERYIGSKKIDSTVNNFKVCYDTNKFSLVDVTNFHGVKTRVQFIDEKPAYSYEYDSTAFPESEEDARNFSFKSNVSIYNNNEIVGTQTYASGAKMMYDSNRDQWFYNLEGSGKTINDYVVISGWLKMLTNNTTLGDPIVCTLSVYDASLSHNPSFTIKDLSLGEWVYFTIRIESNKNYKYGLVCPIVTARLNQNNQLLTTDFKITPQHEEEALTECCSHITHTKNVIFLNNGRSYSFDELDFYLGYNDNATRVNDSQNNRIVTPEDILRYQINKVKFPSTKEVYYNKGKGVISTTYDLTLDIDGTKVDVATVIPGKEYIKGTRHYQNKNIVSGGEPLLTVTENTYGNETYSEKKYNTYLDLISSTSEIVTTEYIRNAKGLVTNQTTGGYLTYLATYDAACTKLLDTTDDFGNITRYTTDDVWGTVTKTTLADGMSVTDAFDDNLCTQILRTFAKNGDEKEHEFKYGNGNLTRMTDGFIRYDFTYSCGDLTSAKKFNSVIEQYSSSNKDKDLTVEYPAYKVKQYLDDYGRTIRVADEDDNTLIENTYDVHPNYSSTSGFGIIGTNNGSSKIATSKDNTTDNTIKYAYDKDNLSRIGIYDSWDMEISSEVYAYDSINRKTVENFCYDVSSSKYVNSTIDYATSITSHSPDNRVGRYRYYVHGKNVLDSQREYEEQKWLDKKILTINGNTYTKEYTYAYTRLSGVSHFRNGKAFHLYMFDVDSQLRTTIEEDHWSNGYFNSYAYDSFGQLTRENNEPYGHTIKYSYDNVGNITRAEYYPYTKDSEIIDSPIATQNYSYNTTIKDRLIGFNGSTIAYDDYGNIISEVTSSEQTTYNWSCGKLSSVSYTGTSSSRTTTFTYDAYGRRIKKVDHSFPLASNPSLFVIRSIDYIYDSSGRLIKENISTTTSLTSPSIKEIIYLYDESSVEGMMYITGETTSIYSFEKNPKGDVVAILDNSNNIVVKYAYDSYGNSKILIGANHEAATLNPFRYRSYYYDRETNLYYLNARYYKPAWRRFISPDSTAYLDPEAPNGLNLYAYCGNDPVNYKDPSGRLAITTIAIITGSIIGFGISATSSIVTQLEEHNGDWSKVNPLEVLYDGAFGAINGGLAASGIGIVASAIFGGVFGFVSSIGRDFLFEEDRNINWLGAVNSLFIGALAGLIAGAGANYAKDGMQVVKFGNSRDILNRTIANGTKRAIARQTHALNVHATQLLISGIRYMLSNTFSISYTMFTN